MDILDFKEKALDAFPDAPKTIEEVHLEHFEIDSVEKLTWFLNKIELLEARIKQHEKIADEKRQQINKLVGEMLDSIESDLINETAGYKNEINTLGLKFGWQAKEFALKHLKSSPSKAKSFKIGSAQIGFRKKPDKAVIENKDQFIEWALENNRETEFVKFETSIVSAKVKEALSDGEVMPGVHLKQGEDEFFMKINSEEIVWDENEE